MDKPEPSWQRQLLVGAAVLLVVAGVLGAVIAGVVVKGASYLGLGGHGSHEQLVIPKNALSHGQHTKPGGSQGAPPPPPTQHKQHKSHACTLQASPSAVKAMQKVTLTGHCTGEDSATLQVQRSVGTGSWSDFPITVHVVDGSYSTYIETGMTGVNHFRMLDKSTGKTSAVATVTIG